MQNSQKDSRSKTLQSNNKSQFQVRHKKRSRRFLFYGFVLMLLLLSAAAAAYAAYYLKLPSQFWEDIIPIPEGNKINVSIEPGMTASQAARAFEIQGALDNDTPFHLTRWLIKFGIDKKIRAGHYSVVPSDAWNLARQLRTAKPALLKAQILPGLDIFALTDSLENQDKQISRQKFAEALLRDDNYPAAMLEFLNELPDDEYTRYVFLMPETYMLIERSADEVVSTAAAAWWKHWGDFIKAHKFTAKELQDASIIASMIEREVLHDTECRTVSGVIQNRLKKDMLLQIDATVVYAWRLKGRKLTRVLNKDLEVESPYNTYRVTGLPPRPICVPNIEAWGAALDPEKNDFYYYVAGKDGYHYFSKTYKEHLQNIKQARSEK
ncbi:MAG: endolytic transglycosylase MltG [Synergistaceae bacterium]|nr:endolytic transglycosylase MltG [Synergistaceae bacterium]